MDFNTLTVKDLKKLSIPIGVLIILIILAFVLGKILTSRVNDMRDELSQVNQEVDLLSQKLDLLNNFSSSSSRVSEAVAIAIPEKSPVVGAISHIRSISSSLGLFTTGLNVGRGLAEGGTLAYSDINFEVHGDLASVVTFLEQLSQTAPIGTVNSVKIGQVAGGINAEIVYRAYYSDFPVAIPSILEPLVEFSDDDNAILTRLTDLTPPTLTEIPPEGPSTNINPFGL